MFDMIPFASTRPYTDAFTIETELPGFDKSEMSVNMKEGVLTVRAEHKDDGKTEEQGYIRRERSSQTVERRFEVSGVDAAAIKAEYVNGVLKLTLPKLPEIVPEQHQIEIK